MQQKLVTRKWIANELGITYNALYFMINNKSFCLPDPVQRDDGTRFRELQYKLEDAERFVEEVKFEWNRAKRSGDNFCAMALAVIFTSDEILSQQKAYELKRYVASRYPRKTVKVKLTKEW